jgi:hypothetical protein
LNGIVTDESSESILAAAQADVVLDPGGPPVRQEGAQLVNLPAQPVDLAADRQRADAERDRRPPVHGVEDREEHARPGAAGKLAHDEDRVVVTVEVQEAAPVAPAAGGERLQVAPQAVGPDGAALVESGRALPAIAGEQPGRLGFRNFLR